MNANQQLEAAAAASLAKLRHALAGPDWAAVSLECAHEAMAPRFRVDGLERRIEVRHCLVCGTWRAVKRGTIPTDAPDFDPEVAERWSSLWALRQERARAEADARHDARRKANADEFAEAHARALASPHWWSIRRRVLTRDRYVCQGCLEEGAGPLDVHHITYRNLGSELAHQLVTLCRDCHERVHFRGAHADAASFDGGWLY